MKRRIAYVILTFSVAFTVAVLIIGIFFGRDIFECVLAANESKQQMDAAKKYMDSLTDKDIQAWIQRTEKYLDHPTNLIDDANTIPPDLQRLGIKEIGDDPGGIEYVWLGGMDDTALYVERMSNGDFQVVAVYTSDSNRMIWPRQVP